MQGTTMNPEATYDVPHATGTVIPSPAELISLYFDHMRGEIVNIINNDSARQQQLTTLQTELTVYKRAYADLEAEKARIETLQRTTEKQREDIENQVKAHRVVALVDGDGAIFDSCLIEQGQAGGHSAALQFANCIKQYMSVTEGTSDYQLWVYVFLNKRGLADTLGRAGLVVAKQKFDDFVIGFNQAAERFMMLDVGNAKEAADAKIKAILESEIRMPQTRKIVFAGCHDNGYVTTLRSHITAGYKEKLILLPSYSEIATGISELDLPHITVPGLFLPQKFNSPTPLCGLPSAAASGLFKDGNASPEKVYFPPHRKELIQDHIFSSGSPEAEASRFSNPGGHLSYSTMLRGTSQRRSSSLPELDSSGSTASSDETDDNYPVPRAASAVQTGTRRINPKLALSKQKPPPCTLFYLANCRHGADCKYGHNYLLEPEHYTEIRENAKKAPCPTINKGEDCTWGDNCCYGHKCPQTTKCYFLKQGRCKFFGSEMHKD